jgi:hypothetical protein
MNLSKQHRRVIMTTQEGNALSNVGSYGLDQAADIARCQIDGLFNAVIRIEGVESASRFAFALSDRVAGGLREPTEAILLRPAPSIEIDIQAFEPKPLPQRSSYWWGIFHGVLTGAAVTLWCLAYYGKI